MDSVLTIADIKSSVEQVAHDYGIKKVTLFGSYATGKRAAQSDIDLLVEFSGRPITLYRIASVKLKLEELTGKSIDVIASPIPPNALLKIDNEVLIYG